MTQMMNELDYWTNFSFEKMRKEGRAMPSIISDLIEMPAFKESSVNEEDLRKSIEMRFASERSKIISKMKKTLNK